MSKKTTVYLKVEIEGECPVLHSGMPTSQVKEYMQSDWGKITQWLYSPELSDISKILKNTRLIEVSFEPNKNEAIKILEEAIERLKDNE